MGSRFISRRFSDTKYETVCVKMWKTRHKIFVDIRIFFTVKIDISLADLDSHIRYKTTSEDIAMRSYQEKAVWSLRFYIAQLNGKRSNAGQSLNYTGAVFS